MAEVDATILSLLRQDTTMDADGLGRGSGEGGGRNCKQDGLDGHGNPIAESRGVC